MTSRTLQNLEQLGVHIHRDGSATVNGERLAPPKLTSAEPLAERIAALEARLTKGGAWIDAEDAWLKAHTGDADWQRRSEEFERQLGRYTALLHELAVLEQAQKQQPEIPEEKECTQCLNPMLLRRGTTRDGRPYAAYFCTGKCGQPPLWLDHYAERQEAHV